MTEQAHPKWWTDAVVGLFARAVGLPGMFPPDSRPSLETPVIFLRWALEETDKFNLSFVRVDDPELAEELATIREDCNRLLGYAREVA